MDDNSSQSENPIYEETEEEEIIRMIREVREVIDFPRQGGG